LGIWSSFTNLLRGKSASPYANGGISSGPPFMDAFRKHLAPSPAELLAENLGTAYACGMLNADLLAGTPLRLFVTTGRGEAQAKMSRRGETIGVDRKTLTRLKAHPPGGSRVREAVRVEEVLSHPMLELLNRPTPSADGIGLSIFELFSFTQLYQEVIGRAYWLVDRDGLDDTPTGIWLLAAHQVKEVCDPSSDRIIDYYQFAGGGGAGGTRFEPSRIVPFRMPDLRNPYTGGMSPLRSVIEQVRILRKVDAHTGALLDNQARPDGLFIPKGSAEGYDIGQVAAARLESAINQRFRRAGRGSVMVAEHDGEFVPLQWPVRDIADLEQFKLGKTVIANGYQVPTSKLDRNDANRASATTGDYAHAKDAGVPRCKRNQAALNTFFVPMWDQSRRLFLAYDSPVPEDREEDREDRKVLVTAGAIIKNELRTQSGLEEREDMESPATTAAATNITLGGPAVGTKPVVGDDDIDGEEDDGKKKPAQAANQGTHGDNVPPAGGSGQHVKVNEDAVLNGAQVTSATAIVTAVASGEIPRDSGIGQLQVLFNLKPEQAEQVMGSAGKADVATTPNPRPAGADNEQDKPAAGAAQTEQPPADAEDDDEDKPKGKKAMVGNVGDDGLAGPLPQGKKIAAAMKKIFADQQEAVLADLEGKSLDDVEGKLISALAAAGKTIGGPAELHAFVRVASLRRTPLRATEYYEGGILVKTVAGDAAAYNPLSNLPNRFIELSEWNKTIADAVQPLIEIIAAQGAKQTITRVGASSDVFSVVEKNIPAAAKALALEFAESTNATTSLQLNEALSKLRDEITAGLMEGDTRVEMRKRVQGVFDKASDSRAAVIAKTEASRAQHTGELMSAKESGVVSKKKWLASADACEECDAIAAAFPDGIDLDQPFATTDYGPVMTPPLHPNCQCSQTLEISEA